MITLESRIRGCLFGVAIGDALGNRFEHVPIHSGPVLEIVDGELPPLSGPWTDDTGSTIALLRALKDWHGQAGCSDESLARLFRRHLERVPLNKPGQTLGSFIRSGRPTTSWGNLALVRSAAVAIHAVVNDLDVDEAGRLAFRVAMLTHRHPLAAYPAVEYVLVLCAMLRGEVDLPDPLFEIARLEAAEGWQEYLAFRRGPLDELRFTTGLWLWRHVMELLGISMPGSLTRFPTFTEGVIRAVDYSSDRDSAGALAGGLQGAYSGVTEIPKEWLATLWQRGLVDQELVAFFENSQNVWD